jgi:hypothetical protein
MMLRASPARTVGEVTNSLPPVPIPTAPVAAELARGMRTPRAAGVAGLAFAALFVASIVLLENHPKRGSSAAEIRDFYLGDDRQSVALVGLYLAPFAGIAFLWFIGAIRSRIGEREDRFFATVFLGSGLLFVAMLFVAAAATGAPMAAVQFHDAPAPSADAIAIARSLGYTLLYVCGIRAAAVFMIATSTIALKTGALPRWLVVLGYLIAIVLLLSVTSLQLLVLLFPAWVAAVSLVLLFRHEEPAPSAVGVPLGEG